jgi:hypothetical protein
LRKGKQARGDRTLHYRPSRAVVEIDFGPMEEALNAMLDVEADQILRR